MRAPEIVIPGAEVDDPNTPLIDERVPRVVTPSYTLPLAPPVPTPTPTLSPEPTPTPEPTPLPSPSPTLPPPPPPIPSPSPTPTPLPSPSPSPTPTPSPLSLTPGQKKALEEHRDYKRYARNAIQDPKNKCISAVVPRIPNSPNTDWYKYATQVSGTQFDYFVMDYNGLGYIFDGLTPGTRDLWEAKHDYGIVLYQGSDRKILQQKNGAIFKVDSALAIEAEIAARCSYGFTAAFSKKGVADFFRARWAGVVDNVDHPYKFDIKHIPYIKSQP